LKRRAAVAEDYPPESIRLGQQGKVQIKYTVGQDGEVVDCAVTRTSGKPRLDDAACAMAKKKWFFKPATQNGRPVSVSIPAEVIFELK
jgi:protein TonB